MAVPTLPAAEVVRVWEEAAGRLPVERAVRLAALAPGSSRPSLDEAAALALGARDRRVLALRTVLFGSRLEALSTCPSCAAVVEVDVDTADLVTDATGWDPDATAAPPVTDLEVDGVRCRVRAPTTLDVVAILGLSDAEAAARALLERCVVEACRGNERVSASALPTSVVEAADAAIAALDPDALIEVSLTCPDCDGSWNAGLDPGELLGRELGVAAQRVFAEVDVLARAYGWTEPEILALGSERRRAYLALAAG